MGYSDLDCRPAPMSRDNLPHEIQNCPNCGYVSYNISEEIDNKQEIRDFISTVAYQDILKNDNRPELTNLYSCASLINRQNKDLEEQFWNILKAAWVCDDAGDDVNATSLRKSAIKIALEINENKQNFAEPETETAIITDLYRRTSQFEKAEEVIEKNKDSIQDEVIKQILIFELQLVKEKDVDCHSIGEAIES